MYEFTMVSIIKNWDFFLFIIIIPRNLITLGNIDACK
jgi:hypothetical protein